MKNNKILLVKVVIHNLPNNYLKSIFSSSLSALLGPRQSIYTHLRIFYNLEQVSAHMCGTFAEKSAQQKLLPSLG